MTELRDYQQELLEQAETALLPADARVMLQLPTGGGKTHIAAALLKRWLHHRRRAVWLTHRTELADQTRRMLADSGVPAMDPAWPSGQVAPSITNGAVILMAQTVGRRTSGGEIWGQYRSDDLLVIDEAHHATADGWQRAIEQWPGRIIGLTATPWRLSKFEGFDHLFRNLISGPQISEMQAAGWLCPANLLMPRPEEIIRGGEITAGDYGESGIEQANSDRPDLMTAGARRFWQTHAAERSTIVYAISQNHARNLNAVFNDAGIPAALMLNDTPPVERASAVASFGNGNLRVLINVAIATEGFDLPDASCIVITRPTMSLALYLPMIGRGLRPKTDGGNCLILDLAGNAETHGLPQNNRRWSLLQRGNNPGGDAPVIRCENCDGVSPAASHFCVNCGAPFGKDCPRCGNWRAWKRWSYETHCGQQHELVCNLCHYDAHIQAHLPVTDELRRLTDMNSELDTVLRNLLEDERHRAGGADKARKSELLDLIADREAFLENDYELNRMFNAQITAMPSWNRPEPGVETYRRFYEWETAFKQELAGWKDELSKLESKVPDGGLIYNNAKGRVLQALESVAQETGLFPRPPRRETPVRRAVTEKPNPVPADMKEWVSFVKLGERGKNNPGKGIPVKPASFRDSNGKETPVKNWLDLLTITIEWLINKKELSADKCPVKIGFMKFRYLAHTTPTHSNGQQFTTPKRLSSGLILEGDWTSKDIARICEELLEKFGQDPAQFHAQLR